MTSLDTAYSILCNICENNHALRSNDRSPTEIIESLDSCPSPASLLKLHCIAINLAEHIGCRDLARLCLRVAPRLQFAVSKAEELKRQLLSPDEHEKDGFNDIHQLLELALRHALLALHEFKALPDLYPGRTKDMVLDYFHTVYQITVSLAITFAQPGVQATFDYWDENINEAGLEAFVFDNEVAAIEPDPKSPVTGTVLEDVIAPVEAVPDNFLPASPQPPLVFPSNRPYGSRILRNSMAEQDGEITLDSNWRERADAWKQEYGC